MLEADSTAPPSLPPLSGALSSALVEGDGLPPESTRQIAAVRRASPKPHSPESIAKGVKTRARNEKLRRRAERKAAREARAAKAAEPPVVREVLVPWTIDREVQMPRTALFCGLRAVWLDRAPGRTNSGLATCLGLTRMHAHDIGKGTKFCPDWVLMALLTELDLELQVRADGVVVCGLLFAWA